MPKRVSCASAPKAPTTSFVFTFPTIWKYKPAVKHRPPRLFTRRAAVAHRQLLALIRTSFTQSDPTYGSPRVRDDLAEWGECCSRKRVARLMHSSGLRARTRRLRPPSDSAMRPEHCIAPNVLDRQVEAAAPNQKWVADFTCIRTREGWLYLAVVLDLFSRRVAG